MEKVRSTSGYHTVHVLKDGAARCRPGQTIDGWEPSDDAVNCWNCMRQLRFDRSIAPRDTRIGELRRAVEQQLEEMEVDTAVG